jgi:hypothetical protein
MAMGIWWAHARTKNLSVHITTCLESELRQRHLQASIKKSFHSPVDLMISMLLEDSKSHHFIAVTRILKIMRIRLLSIFAVQSFIIPLIHCESEPFAPASTAVSCPLPGLEYAEKKERHENLEKRLIFRHRHYI